MKEFYILDIFSDSYFESLFISWRAFLPSLRVLKTSQDRDKVIKKVSVIREIKVVEKVTKQILFKNIFYIQLKLKS